jgi:hypothetical protein
MIAYRSTFMLIAVGSPPPPPYLLTPETRRCCRVVLWEKEQGNKKIEGEA